MKTFVRFTLSAVLCAVGGCAAREATYPREELLIEPAELAEPEATGQFVILDVRPEDEYNKGHLAGARRVDHDQWKAAFEEGQDAEGWSRRIGELGIGPDAKVVVYDDEGMKHAARIWWTLRYWGVDDARLLNGGWRGWKTAELAVTEEIPEPAAPAEFEAKPNARRLTTKEQILDALPVGRLQIVDARSEDEFCGIDKKENRRGGAMPGAKHLALTELIDQETSRFKTPEQLRELFARANVDLQRPTATHCQSGGRASVMVFAMELMGAPDARNYYRGWKEWGNTDDTPIVAPEEPKVSSKPEEPAKDDEPKDRKESGT